MRTTLHSSRLAPGLRGAGNPGGTGMKARKSVFDWQPWMTVALTLSGLLAVAAWAGPRPASRLTPGLKGKG